MTLPRSSRDQGGVAIPWDRDWVRTFLETTIDRAHLVAFQRSRARTSEKAREKAACAHNSAPLRASNELPRLRHVDLA